MIYKWRDSFIHKISRLFIDDEQFLYIQLNTYNDRYQIYLVSTKKSIGPKFKSGYDAKKWIDKGFQ